MSDDVNNAIGHQLKQARVSKGWSLDSASQHTGVSKAMLGQIERGESSPTVARIWKVANGFQLPLSYFFGTISENDAAKRVLNAEKGIFFATVFPYDAKTKMEVFSLTLAPLHEQMSSPHNQGVVEHIIVIEGEIEYFLDNKWHQLPTGGVVKFNANKEHGYRNMSNRPAIFHNIISYTEQEPS